MPDRVKNHNERLKRQMAAEETPETKAISPERKFQQICVLAVLLLTIPFLAWRATQPPVKFEKPPSELVLSDVREDIDARPQRIKARVQNNTGRSVKRAVWLVRYPDNNPPLDEGVIVEDLAAGATREVSLPLIIGTLKAPPTRRVIEPLRIEYGQ